MDLGQSVLVEELKIDPPRQRSSPGGEVPLVHGQWVCLKFLRSQKNLYREDNLSLTRLRRLLMAVCEVEGR